MQDKLLFFPPSLPDESLISRVSRYHLISGNRTEQSTFGELCSRVRLNLGSVVPAYIEVLAARLPGDADANLAKILQDNTLLPAFRPFLGRPNAPLPSAGETDVNAKITHFPRHVVGMVGNAKLCISCVFEDEQIHGVGYWHRSHQMPGVTVCWKHKELLISSCQNCRFPFLRPQKLLSVPWGACPVCSIHLEKKKQDEATNPLEIAYGLFARELLAENIPPYHPEILMNAYREKIRQRGYSRGSMPALQDFQASMIDELGCEFISKVDPAFSMKRASWWLRLSYIESALDMPITRHIILGMYLFGTAHNFHNHLQVLANEDDAIARKKGKKSDSSQNSIRDEFRRKIASALKKVPSLSMEQLWKKQFRTVAWLYDNDKEWLNNTVLGGDAKTDDFAVSSKSKSDDVLDREYALLAEDYSRKLFEKEGKPQRIGMAKILAGVTKNIKSTKANRERFPILFATIDLCKETAWCFSARRILWALGELNRLDEKIIISNIALTSVVIFSAVESILRFADWDAKKISSTKINTQALLAKAGITRTWRGPSESKLGEFGGRGYVRKNVVITCI
ncbi:TnsD family Tn7-like transposition protein [Iodobacter sp. LRB]|uniref:TnsD family Tn7-like transposition protein n=1 Tax=unclassified Iodobacter TaxID=235634 RepID=UPI000C0CCD69|nr:TnsD family Tn7-like transposition protein [Iodobacter sp. BJB302]PHV00098.1 hypothetical protein CSQ88_19010 [Iodobacter sp. BJB302]